MRPELTGTLEKRIERIYKEAGYGTATELVRDAVRDRLNELEAELHTDESPCRQYFSYRIFTSQQHPPEIRLFPKDSSELGIEKFDKGEPPHTALLDTGTSYIDAAEIETALEQIEGIGDCKVSTTTGDIHVYISEENSRGLEVIVDEIYSSVLKLVAAYDERVEEGELTRQESYREAVRQYWDAV